MPDAVTPPPGLASRRALLLYVAVLAFAGYNAFARLDHEMIDVWDESLYATTAFELLDGNHWAVTTFDGQPDYMNVKPPLNSWLIAASFKTFGVNLRAMRLPASTCAFLTIVTLFMWSWRRWGRHVGVLAAVVLSTTYGFLYVHSGRTANADAPLTLAVTLTAIAVWESRQRPWVSAWLGPLAAVVFLLKGPGALAYLAPLVVVDWWNRWRRSRDLATWAAPSIVAFVGFVVPVAAWAHARWRFDGWTFLGELLNVDTIGRAAAPLQGHQGSWLFYLDVLQRHHYDWLVATVFSLALAPSILARFGSWLRSPDASDRLIVVAWLVATVGVPTLVATKLAWYLNSFYPLFALGVALALWQAWHTTTTLGQPRRAAFVVGLAVLATLVAEARMTWRSRVMVDLDRSAQQLLIEHAHAMAGRRIFAAQWPTPEAFLAKGAGARRETADSAAAFQRASTPGDFWLGGPDAVVDGAERIAANRRASLHRRR